MEIQFSPEFEDKLRRAASESGRGAYLSHDKWFRAEVQKGLAQLDSKQSVSHDEVVARIERIFQP